MDRQPLPLGVPWLCFAVYLDSVRPWAKLGVDAASCASDGRRLVALLPGRPAVSEATLQRPAMEVESLQWRASQEATTLPRALGAAWGKSISAFDGPSQCTLRIATSRNSLPRLLLAFPEGLLVSGPAEWRRQLIFLLLLGLRLSNRYQLPEEIWRRKVLPGGISSRKSKRRFLHRHATYALNTEPFKKCFQPSSNRHNLDSLEVFAPSPAYAGDRRREGDGEGSPMQLQLASRKGCEMLCALVPEMFLDLER
ncbi:hypothetical protein AK812_SmicGene7537 [Symbiodinium microadriaticum]|uniref:Uncharacterized protein n=1 Tax=Symbiodinium microadriaticum TaxID=2951 RepID=A0A1Q9ENH1_SYMMI|nr:hypothetical protein AK812_SmicGene7537 [Symbiodinium microadriaticum]